ncbi:MAG: glycosyltransferase family 1 protein [Planctomycetes bacterium]|nr:glycosyltransferase family 1 protein [Planctomycetota bacterium]
MSEAFAERPLPKQLQPLAELAFDLRLSGSHVASSLFERLDPEAWDRTRNPYTILLHVPQERLEEAARDRALQAELADWLARRQKALETEGWFERKHQGSPLGTVAYFSMEFGLSEALPIYSGGLGFLAGDHLKSASDLDVPLVGVGLLYQQGYFRQVIAGDGRQLEALPFNDPGNLPVRPVVLPDGQRLRVRLPLPGRTLWLRTWQVRVGRVTLYLLDSNDPLNGPWDRGITADLYAAGADKRLLQEIVLGVGGWQLLEALGVDPQVCHLNEGHPAFAVLERARCFAHEHEVPFDVALAATRAGNVFTTHTPVAAAFDRFDADLLRCYASPWLESAGIGMDRLLAMGRKDPADAREPFHMAYLALRGAGFVNGVSRLHGRTSRTLFRSLFPHWPEAEVPVGHVTNGVHVPTWDSAPANELWSKAWRGPGRWLADLPTAAAAVAELDDPTIWDHRARARATLVRYVRARLSRQLREGGAGDAAVHRCRHVLDPNVLTLGFARRFTEYKRPNLVLHDLERFARILLHAERPVQFVVAGKSHPNDGIGKAMVQRMAQLAMRDDLRDRLVFLEDHDMTLMQNLAAGIDVWLNNPRRPAEACGTSGMKMLVNGGLNASIRDGWWDEAYAPDYGWAIGDTDLDGPEGDPADAAAIYELLERSIVPEFYDRDREGIPRRWVQRVRASMVALTPTFSSDRMVQDYVERAYLPAAASFRRRAADGAAVAREIEAWRARLADGWSSLRCHRHRVAQGGEGHEVELQVYHGELRPDDVRVELYADPLPGAAPVVIPMSRRGPIPGAVNGFLYAAVAPADRPASHYTPRIVAHHPAGLGALDDAHILWLG